LTVALRLLGVGAMASPRFAPAGLLVEAPDARVMLDGGPGATPDPPLTAWLVTDERAELIAVIRRLGRSIGVEPAAAPFRSPTLSIERLPVVHTARPTWGYRIEHAGRCAVWAPEFLEFPPWARQADLIFADAAGWARPIRFRGAVGGHAAALQVAADARANGVRRLVFAHLGRPTLRALDAGELPPFGEIGREGATYEL
jgi:hypothetical protein